MEQNRLPIAVKILAPKLFTNVVSNIQRFFNRFIRTKVGKSADNPYANAVFFNCRLVVNRTRLLLVISNRVGCIFMLRTYTKIRLSIIKTIAVLMVNYHTLRGINYDSMHPQCFIRAGDSRASISATFAFIPFVFCKIRELFIDRAVRHLALRDYWYEGLTMLHNRVSWLSVKARDMKGVSICLEVMEVHRTKRFTVMFSITTPNRTDSSLAPISFLHIHMVTRKNNAVYA